MITKGRIPTRKRKGRKVRERDVHYLLPQLQIGIELESKTCILTFSWLLLRAIIDMNID